MLRAAALAALSLLAALVVACGGGAASGDADPASAVPADAMLYSEFVVRPSGDVRDSALDALGKVLATDDPSGKIQQLVDRAFSHDVGHLDFETDVKPWLGDHAGVWFSSRLDSEGDPGGSAIIATTDPDAALDAFHKSAAKSKLTKRSYSGTDYEVDKDGVATGIVEDFLVTGPEPDFKRTVDAAKGASLAEADRYRKSVAKLDDGRLAHFYLDLKRVFQLAMQSQPRDAAQLGQLQALVPFGKLPPLVGSFTANGDRLALDMSLEGFNSAAFGGLSGLGGTTSLVKDLPGDSWAAFGAPKYGQQLKAMLDQFAGAFGGAAARAQLQQQYGIDLDEDILSWMGDVAFFARGDSIPALSGGAVIEVTDSGKAANGFGKLVGLMQAAGGVHVQPVTIKGAKTAFSLQDQTTPKPIVMARSDDRVVIAYGAEAAVEALSPSTKLAGAPLYDEAKSALGDTDPGLLASVPAIVKLVEAAAPDRDFAKVRPYLEAYDAIALGYGDGRARFAVGLK
jgi:Protein of unknown function (DUF3352)